MRSMHPCLYIIANEASFLVCAMARIFYTSRMQASGERRFYIIGRGFVLCQFIERVTFARCAYIITVFVLRNIYHIARTDIKGLFTSNSLQCALKRIRIECAFNPHSIHLETFHITNMQCALSNKKIRNPRCASF